MGQGQLPVVWSPNRRTRAPRVGVLLINGWFVHLFRQTCNWELSPPFGYRSRLLAYGLHRSINKGSNNGIRKFKRLWGFHLKIVRRIYLITGYFVLIMSGPHFRLCAFERFLKGRDYYLGAAQNR